MENLEYIGTIELGSSIYVSDPNYNMGIWCLAKLDNVLSGKYNCYVERWNDEMTDGWGERIAALYIFHEDYKINPTIMLDYDIGVDSGQAGFYDSSYFEKTRFNDDWYGGICDLTYKESLNPDYKTLENLKRENFDHDELTEEEELQLLRIQYEYRNAHSPIIGKLSGGIKDNKCCVSSTGIGDGVYPLYVGKNQENKIVSAMIKFLGDEEE